MFNDAVVNAIISRGLWSILFIFLGYLVTKALEYRGLRSINEARRDALKGEWHGMVEQEQRVSGYPTKFEVIFNFRVFWKFVWGKATYRLDDITITLDFFGGFYDERYLKIDYKNHDEKIIQYGLAMLELSADACHLNGRFLGYGHLNQRMINGLLKMKK